jgi:lipopolysaccharide/colanic/teichoic acid biosynthesis glycosyltransferase
MSAAEQPLLLERPAASTATATVWGLDAVQLHDAFWASVGVSCVRLGSGRGPDRGADVFLLLEPDQLVVFDLRAIAESLLWNGADLTRVQLIAPSAEGYRERLVLAADGSVSRIERKYGADRQVSGQVLVAQRRGDAEIWSQSATTTDAIGGIRALRRIRIDMADCGGRCFHQHEPREQAEFVRAIAAQWAHPERVIEGIKRLGDGVFGLEGDALREGDRCVGPLWIGSRTQRGPVEAIGPNVIWDTEATATVRVRPISEIFSPEYSRSGRDAHDASDWYDGVKRALDIVLSATALLVLSPLILVIAIAIMIDDGFPIYFGHRRQARGGRVFRCWKFRTMRRNAEALVAELRKQNLCDGPQVFIKDDPRVTRVGRILRKFQCDEFPQFWNVLRGDMSLVGPRPSPENENQFCPAWREKRLSVRPGITGLWQVMRTRAPGRDFQEWIQYDIEYVERKGPMLDLRIIALTIMNLLRIGKKS